MTQETPFTLDDVDQNGQQTEVWKLQTFSEGIDAGQVSVEISLKGKDQGWGNKKSQFAFSVDTLDAHIATPVIGEWDTFTYPGMLASYVSPIFEHHWTTHTPDLSQLTSQMHDPSKTYHLRFWTKAGGGGGHEIHIKNITGKLTDIVSKEVESPVEISGAVFAGAAAQKPDWVAQCYQNRSTNLAEANLDNCLVTADFGTAKECFKCEEGYTYDEKQHCITLADAETQGICTSLTGVAAGTDECSQCDEGKGNTCAEGQVLVSDGSCVTAITGCDNQDCDGHCLECLNGQYLAHDANVCVPAIDHCKDYESTGACLNCQADYVEVADDKCCPAIQNCKVQSETQCDVCDQICEIGQIEVNDICHVIIPNCVDYNDDGTCKFCDTDYQVAFDDKKVCVPEQPQCEHYYADGNCYICDVNYILVSEPTLGLDKCVPEIDHCGDYDYATEHCHGCVDTQALAYDDDVCVPHIDHCKVYEADGDCQECEAEYLGLSPSTCHEDLPECTKQACSGACAECAYGQVVLAGECKQEIAYCQDYSSNGDCATCASGQHSHDSECHEDKHCDSYNCEGTCVKCADGHTLTEQGVCTDSTN